MSILKFFLTGDLQLLKRWASLLMLLFKCLFSTLTERCQDISVPLMNPFKLDITNMLELSVSDLVLKTQLLGSMPCLKELQEKRKKLLS